jgi:hypothetical protein
MKILLHRAKVSQKLNQQALLVLTVSSECIPFIS